jgi:hypothetical protein
MVLPDSLLALLREGIHNTVEETEDMCLAFDDLIHRWGDEEGGDPISFIQGYIVGQLFASASSTASMTIKRSLNKEEKSQVMDLVDEVRFDIRDLITRLRNI